MPKDKIQALTEVLDQMPHGADLPPLAEIIGCSVEEIVDFSANLNPFGPAPEILAVIREKLDGISHYPEVEPRRLLAALAAKHHCTEDSIILGNGAAELIMRLAMALRLLSGEDEKILLPLPNFTAYARSFAATAWPIETVEQLYNPTAPELAKLWQPEHRALLLCHPNNPTGRLYSIQELRALLERAVELKRLLIVDQCFLDFLPAKKAADYDVERIAAKIPGAEQQILTIYSMTKFYTIPGLRLGYLYSGNPDLAAKLKALSPAWPLNYPAELAALTALNLPEEEKEVERRKIQVLRRELLNSLKAVQGDKKYFYEFSGEANFIAFRSNLKDLAARLLAGQVPVYIRQLKNVPGAPENAYRVAVRGRAEQAILCSALKNIISAEEV